MDLEGLAKRGVRLGYTPDVLNDAGRWITALLCEPCGGLVGISSELSVKLDSGRPFHHVGVNGWSEWWEGASACEERRGTSGCATHLRPRVLDPTETARLVALRVLVSLQLVRPPVERQRG